MRLTPGMIKICGKAISKQDKAFELQLAYGLSLTQAIEIILKWEKISVTEQGGREND